MKIGIDAKRICSNNTGLGSYGRNLVSGLSELQLEDNFVLYAPKKGGFYNRSLLHENISFKYSQSFSKNIWRTATISNDLLKDGIDLYHGISNELPIGINKKIKTIVDIHDLLFIRFPKFYNFLDQKVFRLKTEFACKKSDKIITTSLATKSDIIKYYNVSPDKIEVVYQSCNASFFIKKTHIEKEFVRKKYDLPKQFLLCVGTIQERKNQKQILEALKICKNKVSLVLIGEGEKYKEEVLAFASKNKIDLCIPSKYVLNEDLPAIYQMAQIFVFPGLAEGFGIPVVEAMASKTPVITSINSSMGEIVRNTKCLINPLSVEDIADRIDQFLENDTHSIIETNYSRALEFTNKKFASRVLNIYNEFRNK